MEDWQYQPVHNVFLLIWSELGLIGLILFIWIIWKILHPKPIVPRGTIGETEVDQSSNHWNGTALIFRSILLGFIFIMLFDHYLWDIQQGQLMLWAMLGVIYGLKRNNNKSDTVSL
jgi:hypothetical protein